MKKFDRNIEKLHISGGRATFKRWRRVWLALAILLLGGTGSGLVYGWYFVKEKLIPVVEEETSKYLNRPLELGELKTISPFGARFGESALPATADNPDSIVAESVRIKLDPLYFLRRRILQIDIILVQPDIYLEQGEDRVWTPTDFGTESTGEGGIKVDVETIRLEGGELTLVARQQETGNLNPPVEAKLDRTTVDFVDDGEQFDFELSGEVVAGGSFILNGEAFSKTGVIDLTLNARQLDATEISNLLALPLQLQQGDISGKIGITITENPVPLLEGEATLNNVSLQIPELVKPFSNSNGAIAFDGTELEFNNIATNFGEVAGVVNGTLDLAGEGEYQIDTKVAPVAASKVVEALELEPPPTPIEGKIAGNVRVRGDLLTPVVSFDVNTTTPSRIDKVDFKQIIANLDLVGTTLFVRQFESFPQSGGQIRGTGKLELDDTQDLAFDIFAEDVSGQAIANSYNNPLPIDIGVVSGQTQLFAQAGNLNTLRFDNGSANFALGNGEVKIEDLTSGGGNWQLQVETQDVEFGSLPFGKGSTPTIAQGKVDGVFDVSGKTNGDINQVRATGRANLDTVGGKIAVPNFRIANGTWRADANTDDIQLRQLFPEVPSEFNDDLSGEFYLTGNIPTKTEDTAIINGFGDLNLAGGEVEVRELNIVDDDWKAIASGTNLELKQLSSTTPEQFAGLIDGTLKLSGTTDNITPEAIAATGNGSLTLPEGVFAAENLAIADGNFKTTVIPQGVDLSLFADPNSDDIELNGELGGQLEVTGEIDKLDPTAVAAEGTVTFSRGIDLLEQPFAAAVRWNGSRLDVLQATGEGLSATGYIELDESFFSEIPDKLAAVNYFEFDVAEAEWIDIRKLRVTLPSWATNLDYVGRGDFSGTLSGVPAALNIDGNIGLRNFRVENIDFAPILIGKIQSSPDSGVNLKLLQPDPLEPQPDKIELVLNRDFLPVELAIARDDIFITGTGEDEILEITTESVPLAFLKTVAIKSEDIEVPENLAVQPIGGRLSGNFVFNLNTLGTSGKNIFIDSPAWAGIKGESLTGDFQYADNYFALQNGEFQQRDSTYQLEGSILQTEDDLEVDGNASITQGKIQDILIALQIFELGDLAMLFGDRQYGDAADLYLRDAAANSPLFSIDSSNASILEQLQQLAAVQASLDASERERQQAFLPELKTLRGTFNGKLSAVGSVKKGLNSQFAFSGADWRWGNLAIARVVADGSYRDGILTLLPIGVELQEVMRQSDSSPISPELIFTGTFGGETQSGQFRLREVPVELIEQMFALPTEIVLGGEIDATASIAGTPENPQARGEITVDNASIDRTSIQTTKGSFNYNNARLDFFASSIVAANAEPLTVSGTIPYQLPTATVAPESDRLELELNVRNRGLELLDILSRGEFSWIDGKGEIALNISGKLDPESNLPRELVTKGTAELENATLASRTLPDTLLTNVNSKIFFDLNKIRVENFQGDFGGGKISVIGNLPLTNEVAVAEPLTIALDDIFVNLKGLYNGGVAGKLKILGAAIEPDIAGEVTLFDGTILLADTTATDSGNNAIDTTEGIVAATEYRNLQLELGENIEVSQPPIFTFDASGTIDINGTFVNPVPEGTIVLERGQVNLFTTQLNLSRDYDNIARFTDKNPLDPFLDVVLVGSAVETTNSRIPVDPLSNEISDIPASNFGTLETVRISAQVKGNASQITNNIQLSSSPPRSQTEIIALLGGGFVNTLGRGSSPLGLANLAGSALFGSLNNQFNNAFPIGELRLFATQIIDENRADRRIDGLAGEIAIDLVDDFSFSVLKILNVDEIPAQFGFRYRLDNNFVLRGSTNFDDETRGLIEYEQRF